MAARKGCCVGGCLLKLIITIVVIVALIGGSILVVSNMTLEKLGLADIDLGGTSIRELGLEQTKLKDIFTLVKNLMRPDESSIVTNPFDPVADKASTDATAGDIGLPNDSGGNPDYLSLLGDDPITTELPMLVSFEDTEIAYMMDSMVNQASGLAEEEGGEEAEIIKEMNAGISQVIINEGTADTLEIMLAINISSIKDDIPVPFVGNMLPNTIYLNSINEISIDSEGIISTTSSGITINGMTDATATVIIDAIFNSIPQSEGEENPVEFFNDAIGGLFAKVMNNIGLVGDADLDTEDEVIVATIIYGEDGLEDHFITLITRVDEVE